MEISAYNINSKGILCYSGLPILAKDLKFENHNGIPYCKRIPNKFNYEVYGLNDLFLFHGIPYRIFDQFGNEIKY